MEQCYDTLHVQHTTITIRICLQTYQNMFTNISEYVYKHIANNYVKALCSSIDSMVSY